MNSTFYNYDGSSRFNTNDSQIQSSPDGWQGSLVAEKYSLDSVFERRQPIHIFIFHKDVVTYNRHNYLALVERCSEPGFWTEWWGPDEDNVIAQVREGLCLVDPRRRLFREPLLDGADE